MTFATKYIEVDFEMAQGVFQGGSNSYTASGLRVSAQIVKAGGLSFGAASLAIFGLPLTVMNQLGTFGNPLTVLGRNSVTVRAGDDPSALTTVFTGTIFNAYMDGQMQPSVPFRVEAQTLAFEAVTPVPVVSQPGAVSVASMMGQIAASMGLSFENNGVDTTVTNPYLPGTATQQLHKLVKAAGIEHIVDNGTLAIWKPGSSRQGAATTISPSTGLVGYPRFNSQGIDLTTLWQPTIAYGQNIQVESSITPACGTWTIYRLAHDLESQTPNGPWFCEIMASPPGLIPVA